MSLGKLTNIFTEDIHKGERAYRMDLTYHEAHGVLFTREDDKGSGIKTFILALLLLVPGVILALLEFSYWYYLPVFGVGFGIFMYLYFKNTKRIHKIIVGEIDNYKIENESNNAL